MPVWIKFWTGWAICLALVLVTFLVAEGWALARDAKGDTLSESIWYLRDQGRWLYWLILDTVYVTALTMAWLIFHLRFQSGRD